MNMQKTAAVVALGLGTAAASFAAVPTEVSGAISSAVTDILAVVAIGGAAYITISGGGVIWSVASKFIKRLGSKA